MKTAIWFSGGKDSLACVYLLRNNWHESVVLWANTGKNFPEVLETIERVRKEVPNFVEIPVDIETQQKIHGMPSDVVPVRFTKYAEIVAGQKSEYKIQNYIDCCRSNIATPLFKWCVDNKIESIVKGQRNDESHKSLSKDGDIIDGITFLQPIENWTKDEVLAYLKEEFQGDLPEHLYYDHSSMDCYNCTAYLDHASERIDLMKRKYPEWYEEFKNRLYAINTAVTNEMVIAKQIVEGVCHGK